MVVSFTKSNIFITKVTKLCSIPTHFLKDKKAILKLELEYIHKNDFPNSEVLDKTTWCSARSIAGNGNSQNSQVTILWGQFSPLWISKISRSIVSLHIEHATCTNTHFLLTEQNVYVNWIFNFKNCYIMLGGLSVSELPFQVLFLSSLTIGTFIPSPYHKA